MRYALVLNDMRSSNVENVSVVRLADTREELVEWYTAQIGAWKDGRWHKAFRQGSDLEWMNPAHDLTIDNDYWGGIWTVQDNVGIGAGLVKGGAW